MVELSNEMLETYQMTLYKSLVFKDVEEALPTILNCLDADKKKAKKVKEVVAGGQIQSGYYQLPQLKEDVNRFILFKTGKKGSATLIYIEGELDADDLVTMLFMKKTKHYKNMKHIYLLLFMLIPMTGMAQEGISQDTTLYVNGRKILIKENEGKIKVKLYEQSSHGDTIENDQILRESIRTDKLPNAARHSPSPSSKERTIIGSTRILPDSIWDTHGSLTASTSILRTD